MKCRRSLFVMLFSVVALFTSGAGTGPSTPNYNHFAYLPIVLNQFFYGVARYMRTTDNNVLYNEGCNQGLATPMNQAVYVILAFGQPGYDTGNYGVYLFDGNGFRSTTSVEYAIEEYAWGFYSCSPSGAWLDLAIGLNNYNGLGTVSYNHGVAWAQMVSRALTYIRNAGWGSKVVIDGGNDMEQDWASASATRGWVDGYMSSNSGFLFNFGSCTGCPTQWMPTPGTLINNGWTVDDVWYISSGDPFSQPIPEIYNTYGLNANQWQLLSLYAYNYHGQRMFFPAELTEWQACKDRPPCNQIDNSPRAGWLQLTNRLNSDPNTSQATRIYPIDITWQY